MGPSKGQTGSSGPQLLTMRYQIRPTMNYLLFFEVTKRNKLKKEKKKKRGVFFIFLIYLEIIRDLVKGVHMKFC